MFKALALILAVSAPLWAGAQGLPIQTFGLGSKLTADSIPVCRIDNSPVPYDSLVKGLNEHAPGHIFRLAFSLRNNTDSVLDLSLYCGQLDYVDAWLESPGRSAVHVAAGTLLRQPRGSNLAQRYYAALPLRLEAREQGTLRLSLRQVQQTFYFYGVGLYAPAALNNNFAEDHGADHGYYVFEWLFQGFLICQLIFVLFQSLIIRRREYFYYFWYLLAITLYFLGKYETELGIPFLFTRFPVLKIYLSKTLLIIPFFLYVRFVRSFLDVALRYPRLDRWLVGLEYFLLFYAGADLVLSLATFNPRLQTEIFTPIQLAAFLATTCSTIYLFRIRETLTYYILTASLVIGVSSVAGQVFTYLELYRHIDLGIDHILIFPQVGIVLEILCFTAGLGHKNQIAEKEKLQSQERLIEQLKANELLQTRMQTIRNKIAQDLHDDIGSTLSSISILSDLALHEKDRAQNLETMSEIKDSAILLMEKMDDIVWSINPRNDSLENLLMRVRHFATTLFEAKAIEYHISIQKGIDKVKLPMDARQHVYMILKEAINNLVKYAGASHASIDVSFDAAYMELSVKDNGRGFEADKPSMGNGVSGMRRRADLMQAELILRTGPGLGTEVVLRLGLA